MLYSAFFFYNNFVLFCEGKKVKDLEVYSSVHFLNSLERKKPYSS